MQGVWPVRQTPRELRYRRQNSDLKSCGSIAAVLGVRVLQVLS